MVFGGNWRNSYCDNGEQVGDKVRYPVHGAKCAVYPLPVEKAGRYRLYGKVPYRWLIAPVSSTAVSVKSAALDISFRWNQTLQMGEWVELGVFRLEPGATLTIDPAASKGTVIADGFAIAPAAR